MSGEVVHVGVRELRQGLSGYLRQASEGKSIIVTSRDKIVAELRPPARSPTSPPAEPALPLPVRKAGLLKGKIWIGDDFDSWPEGFLDSLEADL